MSKDEYLNLLYSLNRFKLIDFDSYTSDFFIKNALFFMKFIFTILGLTLIVGLGVLFFDSKIINYILTITNVLMWSTFAICFIVMVVSLKFKAKKPLKLHKKFYLYRVNKIFNNYFKEKQSYNVEENIKEVISNKINNFNLDSKFGDILLNHQIMEEVFNEIKENKQFSIVKLVNIGLNKKGLVGSSDIATIWNNEIKKLNYDKKYILHQFAISKNKLYFLTENKLMDNYWNEFINGLQNTFNDSPTLNNKAEIEAFCNQMIRSIFLEETLPLIDKKIKNTSKKSKI